MWIFELLNQLLQSFSIAMLIPGISNIQSGKQFLRTTCLKNGRGGTMNINNQF